MTDEQRAAPANGIWLCGICHTKVDADAAKFPAEALHAWKDKHEAWVEAGRPTDQPATREKNVTGGGIGSIITNEGPGTALKITGVPGQTAERINVQGPGIGEIITNTGFGTAKTVSSSGGTASEVRVTVDRPAKLAAGLTARACFLTCEHCTTQFAVSKVVQGFVGDEGPRVQVNCPNCGRPTMV